MGYVIKVKDGGATRIIGATGANGDFFGTSLDATDDYLAVGANYESGSFTRCGVLHIFEKSGGAWAEVAQFEGDDQDYRLGDCVVCKGEFVFVGVYNRPTTERGCVRVFRRVGGTWTDIQTVQSTDPYNSEAFGRDIDASNDGSKLFVGCIGETDGKTKGGKVQRFSLNSGTGLFELVGLYEPSSVIAFTQFGASVAASEDGETVAVGWPRCNIDGNRTGKVGVFDSTGSHWLSPTVPVVGSEFGKAVGIGNNVIAVSAPYADSRGYLYIFERTPTGWEQTKILTAEAGVASNDLGARTNKDTATLVGRGRNHLRVVNDSVVLAPSVLCRSLAGGYYGAVWIFNLNDDTARSLSGNVSSQTNFGNCALSESKLLIGSPALTPGITATSGAVYELEQEDWDPSYGSVIPDTTAPTITLISPAAVGQITTSTPLVFDVQDETSLAHVEIAARQNGVFETVYNGTAIVSPYTGTVTTIAANHLRFSVIRLGGWRSDVRLRVTPIDHAGNKA